MTLGVLKTLEELQAKKVAASVKQQLIKIHPNDNVIVALTNLKKGTTITFEDTAYTLTEDIPAKHKIFMQDMKAGDKLVMYGVLVGTLQTDVISALPVAILMPHSACNCRCVMCDIWKETDRRDIGSREFERYLEDFRNLLVRWVVLSGGEPLMHSNL